jgi:hypothetical protein
MPNSMSLHMSTCISATELESVCQLTYQVQYLLICQMLYPICYVLYAGWHMPRLICQFLYVEYHMLASYCKFAIVPVYMPISVPVSACSVIDLICQLQYTCIYMPAHECQISVVRYQVSLYANLGCYMSNYYISVYMPNALCYILCTEWYGLYAKIHMPDCYMPNAMTIPMSFSMTT